MTHPSLQISWLIHTYVFPVSWNNDPHNPIPLGYASPSLLYRSLLRPILPSQDMSPMTAGAFPSVHSSGVCAVQTRYEGACDSAFISPVAPVPLHFIVNLSWEKIYVITPYTFLSPAYWRCFSFVFFIHVFSNMLFVLLIYSLFKRLHWVKKNDFHFFLTSVWHTKGFW